MQPPETHADIDHDTEPRPIDVHRLRLRLAVALSVLLVVLLLVFVPPLINMSRFQRRVDRSISTAIGRPVHFDKLTLSLLPMPGFTLENFVVDEDPAFGYEPILRSNQVQVTLRISSLWRRHVEFSTISLDDSTSINLVHLSDGRWNIESLLFQASHIQAAPTAQRYASEAPRFPYIEASGARVNLKLDQTKTPFSLTDSDFALWEDQPHQWHLRVEAQPARTDTSPGETGTLRIEGTIGRPDIVAASLADTPIDLQGDWREAQLGGLTQFVTGNEAGVRGDIAADFALKGTIDRNTITANISVANARRADFIPSETLSLKAGCRADSSSTFHAFTGIECHWPPAGSSNRSILIATAQVPNVLDTSSATVHITVPALPASTFFNWLAVATPHPPTGLSGPGVLSGSVDWAQTGSAPPSWTGELEFTGGTLTLDAHQPIPLGDVFLRSSTPPSPPAHGRRRAVPPAPLPPDSFDLEPVSLDLGGKQPATLTGHLDDSGYTLHLTGSVVPERLLALGDSIPQLGDGLKQCLPASASTESDHPATRGGVRGNIAKSEKTADQPLTVDLTATRTWGEAQSWCPAQKLSSPQTTANPLQISKSK